MSSSTWPAPVAGTPVVATVRLPGSKSMTNRALVLAALTAGRSTIRDPLHSRDSSLMIGALRTIGATIDDTDDDAWVVTGDTFTHTTANVDVGNAGTVLRFTPPVAVLTRAGIGFDGDDAVRRRPVGPLIAALRDLGADIDDGGRGAAPFIVRGTGGIAGGTVSLDASSSSQLVSALLLSGGRYRNGVDVRHVGERPVPNTPHLRMTASMLRDRGITVEAEPSRWRVTSGELRAVDGTIEPDLSSAAPFLAAAVVTAGQVTIAGWPKDSTQPGALLADLLPAFGAAVSHTSTGLQVSGPGTIQGADLDLRDAGELTPVLAAIAALASTPSRLTGIDYLRGHETDRLAALARELTALGAEVAELSDGLAITPRPMHGGVFATYEDHRLAMAGAVLGLVIRGVEIENVETTAKTLPGFVTLWRDAVAHQGAAR